MSAPDLMADLWAAGFLLTLDGDRLRVLAPVQAATPEIVALIRRHKAEIIDFILWTRGPGEEAAAASPATPKGASE